MFLQGIPFSFKLFHFPRGPEEASVCPELGNAANGGGVVRKGALG